MGRGDKDVAPGETAFAHRIAHTMVKAEFLWEPDNDPALVAANLDWLRDYFALMEPHLEGSYQNFPGRERVD